MFSHACNIVVLVLTLCFAVNASVIEGSGIVRRDLSKTQSPKLVAVAARSGLQLRHESFIPNHHGLHHYAESAFFLIFINYITKVNVFFVRYTELYWRTV